MPGGLSIFGGGFFYAPFTTTVLFQPVVTTSGAPGVFGAWVPATTGLNFQGRWMDVRIFGPTGIVGDIVGVQLGLGAAGAETPWQPNSAPPGSFAVFAFRWFPAGASQYPTDGYSFPISLPFNNRLSIRSLGGMAAINTFIVSITIWG